MKYLRVTVDGPYETDVLYVPLEDGQEYTQEELVRVGQDAVNDRYSWGIGDGPIDEDEVPEDERIGR